jgi:tetratricopeptide (TPR) repeat protein
VLCGLAVVGCSPSGTGVTDEKREPQFLIGLSRKSAMDFEGAVESFQQALEANPHSAAAHLQLGELYAAKVPDPAAAIYHYEQFLKRQPTSPEGEVIRRNILILKQNLAEAVLAMSPAAGVQKELERMIVENRRLRDELEMLRTDLAARAGSTNRLTGRLDTGRVKPVSGGSLAGGNLPAPNSSQFDSTSASIRRHKVVAGDTPASLARRYRIKVAALLAANPGLNPKRMRIDQNVSIPAK